MKLKKLFVGLVSLAATLIAVCAITVCAGAYTYVSGDYEYEILDDDTVEITDYNGSATDLEIPSTLDGIKVTSIGDWAFSSRSTLTSVTIPDSVTSIGSSTFYSCDNLITITIPDSVKSIGRDAFTDTPLLREQTGVEKYVGKWAVKLDGSLTTVTLKSGTVGIADNAFEYCCREMTSITLPDTLMNLNGSTIFEECSNLTSITVDINNKYFSSKDGVLFNKDFTKIITFPQKKAGNYIIPEGVISVENSAFKKCCNLTSIQIPNSVTTIGANAFEDCDNITSIIIPDGVTRIDDKIFYGCDKLASISIPDSVTSIDGNAFLGTPFLDDQTSTVKYSGKWAIGCDKNATDATVKSGIIGIADNAFNKCLNLTAVKLPDGVISIGEEAFSYCSSLKSINIPESVTCIKKLAFSSCHYLFSLILYDNITSIGEDVFYSSGVDDIYYTGSIPQWKMIDIGKSNRGLYEASKHYHYNDNTGPTAVSGVKVKDRTTDSLILSWEQNTRADGYRIEVKDGSEWVSLVTIDYNNTTTEYRIDDLEAGTEYHFRICTYWVDGKDYLYSDYSTISARTDPSSISAPSSVSGLNLKGRSGDALRLTWTKNTSADGYIIEMKDGSKWTRVGKITNNSTVEFKKSKLKAGTAYDFRIRAYKMNGKTALYSGYTTISARTNPSAVSGLKLKARAADALRLAWTKNTSADGYIIEMKSGNTWTRVGKITKNSTIEFKKSKLKAGTAYTFRVKAYKMNGKTALYSATKTISVRTNPSAVSGLKLKNANSNAVRLAWTKNTSADGYIIEIKSGNSWTRVGKVTKNSTVEFRKGSLKSKTSYTFRVKAYKMSGKTALYSGYKTITVKTK